MTLIQFDPEEIERVNAVARGLREIGFTVFRLFEWWIETNATEDEFAGVLREVDRRRKG